jgi:acetoacetyl-CoA synthetase
MTIAEGTLLWEPSEALRENCALTRYAGWLESTRGLHFDDYDTLWRWSVDNLGEFWASLWDFFELLAERPAGPALASRAMPGARWFAGARLNYAQELLRRADEERPAILFRSESEALRELSWAELGRQAGSLAAHLRAMGVQKGDRVVAYIPNIPEAVIALVAVASLGAIWSSCSPDFGTPSVVDRFTQIAPKVLIAVDGYRYGGQAFDKRATVAELRQALPTVEQTILIPYLAPERGAEGLPGARLWPELIGDAQELRFEPLDFDHPLWVLYSSGTTGLPKPIVQGHGGILLEHLKSVSLHLDLGPGDRFFWFTTTGWMMWNFLVGGLLAGTTILLYDGSPGYPDLGAVWQFAQDAEMTFLGTSAAYVTACMKQGIEPARQFDLRALRGMGYTGSPLPPEGFAWIYAQVGQLWLASISGGTDVCTAFVGGCPWLPVRAGETQCRCLGCKVEAYDEAGRPLIGDVGELVVTEPMPSMPLFLWGDEQFKRYRESYFEQYPGVWRHGDWCKITEHGGVVIYGRSDSTINRQGVRMGTSELYRAVEAVPEVLDSLVIDLEGLGPQGAARPPYMALFVVLREGLRLDAALTNTIKQTIRQTLSARHVPDEILQIAEVPRTLNGKKLEVPVKKILLGLPADQAASRDSLANPQALDYFVSLAAARRRG